MSLVFFRNQGLFLKTSLIICFLSVSKLMSKFDCSKLIGVLQYFSQNYPYLTFCNQEVIFMIYGYARVSTKMQAAKGFSLDEQVQQLATEGCEKIYRDVYTGKTAIRPELEALRGVLKPGDTLICVKLDRLCRNVQEGLDLISELRSKGVSIKILNIGTLDGSPVGKFLYSCLLAVAELERSMIIERTSEGKAIAKLRPGYREGRPKTDPKKIKAALKLLEDGEHSIKEICEVVGISRSTLMRAKKNLV